MKKIIKKSVLMLLVALLLTGTTATIATYATVQEVQAAAKKGWRKTGNTFYYYKNGRKVKGWQRIGKHTYYFNAKNRKMVTGVKKIGGRIYYFRPTGKKGTRGRMLTGWQKVGNRTYYFKKTGAIKTKGSAFTGWNKIGKNYHYFNKNGVVQVGTKKIGKKTYFLDPKNKGVAYIPKTTKTKVDDKTKPIYEKVAVQVSDPSGAFEYTYGTSYGTRCNVCNTIVRADHPQFLQEFNIGTSKHEMETDHSWFSSGIFNNIPIGKTPKMITEYQDKLVGYQQKTVTKTTYTKVTSKPK